ncbi:methyltransferase domain-containing protein [Flavobacteriaceae bacterium F89]|uniref:Methyltransferase domain-containing protein n=1 Tax=Cerina litoralis TaxID=2874477 RepID=A0AAE3EUG2_9FLAO|nr:methyltransferase domain-containing protein [Cerina litoralis]MCG2461307.1 methyltransferase domain-containing protein [Cerina litoralis]
MLVDLSIRSREPELMDDPTMDLSTLGTVFRDINLVNRLFNGTRITINAVDDLVKEHPKDSYTIIDMGCGDGNMLRQVALHFRKSKIKGQFIGIDLNENALAMGRKLSNQFPEISFLKQNILALDPSELDCDILLCTLTMHHFRDHQIPDFLGKFVQLSHLGVIINDLQRSRSSYYLFKAFRGIFLRTKIAKHDGLVSIKSGFSRAELEQFSRSMPQINHRIHWKWAFRYLWILHVNRLANRDE